MTQHDAGELSEQKIANLISFYTGITNGCVDKAARAIIDRLRSAHPAPAQESAKALSKRPVAFRVRDCADGWIVYQDEEQAYKDAVARGAEMQGLYVRDGSPQPQQSAIRKAVEVIDEISAEHRLRIEKEGLSTPPPRQALMEDE